MVLVATVLSVLGCEEPVEQARPQPGPPSEGSAETTTETSAPPFVPSHWTLEFWGLYDGETLQGFQFGAYDTWVVPAHATVRFWDAQEETCSWSGELIVEGRVPLTDDQWNAWVFRLETIDNDCAGFDPEVWGDTWPAPILEAPYWVAGVRPRGDWVEAQFDAEESLPWTWGETHAELAHTLQLGFEPEPGVYEHQEAGAAYAVEVQEGDQIAIDVFKRPHPVEADGEALAGLGLVCGTFGRQPVERLLDAASR